MAADSSLKEVQKSVAACRDDFPMLKRQMNGKRLAFLDSAASAQKPQIVIDAMNSILESNYSNVHRGLYSISQSLTEEYELVRGKVANFINAPSDKSIIFTRNTTESINLVAQSWGRTHLKEGDEIIISAMEHHANIVPWQMLSESIGLKINVIPLNDKYEINFDEFKNILSDGTKLVSVMHVSNALGVENNINKVIELSREFNPKIKILIDGSQAVVHMPIDVQALDADFYAFTGHKLYGPTGIGVLYGKQEVLESMPPYQGGGDMIEKVSFKGTTYKEPPFRFEAGTPPIVEVIGLGASVDYCVDIGMDRIAKHEAELTSYAHARLKEIKGLHLYGKDAKKIGVFSFTMDCAHPSDIAMVLDQCGVAVRTGHHCCMPLMELLGIEGTTRASIGMYNNRKDIDQLIDGLRKVQELFG